MIFSYPLLVFEVFGQIKFGYNYLFSKKIDEETFRISKQEILIVESIKRDRKNFESFYNIFFDRIFKFAFHRVSDEYIAEEISSSVFIKAYRSIDQFEYRNYSISSWLFKITVNEINLYFRKHKHQLRNVSIRSDDVEVLFEEMALDDSRFNQLDLLSKVIEQLNEDEVQFIELRYFENYSFKEIGFFLNMTHDNAKTKTYRILEKMKSLLIKMGYGKD